MLIGLCTVHVNVCIQPQHSIIYVKQNHLVHGISNAHDYQYLLILMNETVPLLNVEEYAYIYNGERYV